MFEHHTLLWKESADEDRAAQAARAGSSARSRASTSSSRRRWRRGGSRSRATGRASASRCTSRAGQSLNVREHHFLAATDNLDYSFERVKGVRNMLLGGSGFFIDTFAATDGDAVVWV